MDYQSTIQKRSELYPGVEYTIARLSLGRRIELGRRIREVGLKGEFLEASSALSDQIEAGVLRRRVDRIYLEWGLLEVKGLRIDGQEAQPALLVELGPEDLCQEVLAAIQAELALSGEERKN